MANFKKLTILHSNDLHGDFMAKKVDEELLGGMKILPSFRGAFSSLTASI